MVFAIHWHESAIKIYFIFFSFIFISWRLITLQLNIKNHLFQGSTFKLVVCTSVNLTSEMWLYIREPEILDMIQAIYQIMLQNYVMYYGMAQNIEMQ